MSRRAPAIDRAVAVLGHLAAAPSQAFSLSDLARELDESKATLHALLGSLVDAGYLLRDADAKTYTLGPALIALGAAASSTHPAARLAQPHMDALSQQLDLQVICSTAVGGEIVILGSAGRPRPLGINVVPGQRLPLVPPLGTVFVAWAGEERIEAWLDQLGPDATDADRDRYRAALAVVRDAGYSVALGGEQQQRMVEQLTSSRRGSAGEYALTELGDDAYAISQIGAPVFDSADQVVLGLFLIGFRGELAADEVPRYIDATRRAAEATSAALRG